MSGEDEWSDEDEAELQALRQRYKAREALKLTGSTGSPPEKRAGCLFPGCSRKNHIGYWCHVHQGLSPYQGAVDAQSR